MLSNQRIIFILLFGIAAVFNSTAQQLQGRVTNVRGYSMQGVTVINRTAKMGTVTNIRGRYAINFSVGDTIRFSNVGYNDFTLVMEDLPEELKEINITLEVATTTLDEVIVNSDQISDTEIQKIIDQNFGAITPERRWTQTERRAYTASTGSGLISFDYILNLINGRIKRLKLLSLWEKQDAAIAQLQESLPETFFTERLGLTSEEVYPFLLYCAEKSIHALETDEKLTMDIVDFFKVNLEKYREARD